jgi:hypothetical protein
LRDDRPAQPGSCKVFPGGGRCEIRDGFIRGGLKALLSPGCVDWRHASRNPATNMTAAVQAKPPFSDKYDLALAQAYLEKHHRGLRRRLTT